VTDRAAHLYDLPLYYDIAFATSTDNELAVLGEILHHHAIHPPAHLLEPACGSARLAIPLAQHGYHITGYDLNDAMLDFGRQRIAEADLADRISLHHADMVQPHPPGPFDAAFCMIGSIGHLHDDQRIITHLRRTGQALKPDGLYIVQLTCLYEADSVHEHLDWAAHRDGIHVHTFWEVEYEDPHAGLARQHCRLIVTPESGEPIIHDDRFDLRIWTFADWRMLIDASGVFDLIAIYDETGDALAWDDQQPVTGEDGNLLYVLRRTERSGR